MRRTVWLVLAVGAASLAFAFQWPTEGPPYAYGFGSFRDGFLKGVEFDAADGQVRAIADGEVVFSYTGSRLPGGYPVSGGGLEVLSHHSGMMSVYAGLSPRPLGADRMVKAGSPIGSASPVEKGARGALLFVYDTQERRFVNPVMVMEKKADDKPPAIRGAAFVVDGREVPLVSSTELRQGSWFLLVDAVDASPSGQASPPFELRVLVDGSERARVLYDASWSKDGASYAFTENPTEERGYLMPDGRVRFGPLQLARGKSVVTVTVADYAGNRRESSWVLSVQ